MKRILCFFMLVLFLTSTNVQGAIGWTGPGHIVIMNTNPSVDINFWTDITSTPQVCTIPQAYKFFVVDENSRRMFILLLAASLSGKQVILHTTGVCSTEGYAVVDVIQIF